MGRERAVNGPVNGLTAAVGPWLGWREGFLHWILRGAMRAGEKRGAAGDGPGVARNANQYLVEATRHFSKSLPGELKVLLVNITRCNPQREPAHDEGRALWVRMCREMMTRADSGDQEETDTSSACPPVVL